MKKQKSPKKPPSSAKKGKKKLKVAVQKAKKNLKSFSTKTSSKTDYYDLPKAWDAYLKKEDIIQLYQLLSASKPNTGKISRLLGSYMVPLLEVLEGYYILLGFNLETEQASWYGWSKGGKSWGKLGSPNPPHLFSQVFPQEKLQLILRQKTILVDSEPFSFPEKKGPAKNSSKTSKKSLSQNINKYSNTTSISNILLPFTFQKKKCLLFTVFPNKESSSAHRARVFMESILPFLEKDLNHLLLMQDFKETKKELEKLYISFQEHQEIQTTSFDLLKEELENLEEQEFLALKKDFFIGNSSEMEKVVIQANILKDHDLPVLIQGESGTGKEVMARFIHYLGKRRRKPFVSVNCAAIPTNLLESELFGHVKGAFTGANRSKKGLFLEAGEGTLFLDEIGEMPLEGQVKLLRALEERKIRPLGGKKFYSFQGRVIAATNKNLEQLMKAGKFREDLYYRIASSVLYLPPLRERGDDSLLFFCYFWKNITGSLPHLSKGAEKVILKYSWPGNIREVKNEVERLTAFRKKKKVSQGDVYRTSLIRKDDFSPRILQELEKAEGILPIEKEEERIILQALEKAQGNKARAARALGINRSTLYDKIRKYGLERK